MEWKEVRLGDIATFKTGKLNSNAAVTNGKYPFFTCSPDVFRINDYAFDQEALLLAGNNAEGNFNIKYYNGKFNAYQRTYVISTKENVDIKYLYYALRISLNKFKMVSQGTSTKFLTAVILNSFSITLPPLDTQRKISSVLSSLDDKIETNNKLNSKLEEMAQAIFKEWFVDFGPFKNGKMVEGEMGMIPEGWKVGKLGDVADVIGGGTPSKSIPEYYTDAGIHWITPKDLSLRPYKFTTRGENDITELGLQKSSAKLMPRGTVLFSSRAPIGYISIASNEICTNQGFKSLVPKTAGTCYLYNLMKYKTPEIESKSTGSTFKEASGSLIKSLDIVIPSKEVLDSFERLLQPIFNKQEIISEESQRLSTLRDSLLPKLMKGEIKI